MTMFNSKLLVYRRVHDFTIQKICKWETEKIAMFD